MTANTQKVMLLLPKLMTEGSFSDLSSLTKRHIVGTPRVIRMNAFTTWIKQTDYFNILFKDMPSVQSNLLVEENQEMLPEQQKLHRNKKTSFFHPHHLSTQEEKLPLETWKSKSYKKLHIYKTISHHMAKPAIMTHSMAISSNNCPSKLRVAWKYAELTPTRIRRNQMRWMPAR